MFILFIWFCYFCPAIKAISPVVTNVGEAVKGRLQCRVMKTKDYFVARHITSCTQYLRASYTSCCLVQLNGLCAQLIALSVSLTVTLYVLLDSSTNKSTAGIKLTYSFLLPYFLSLAADMSMVFFSLMPGMNEYSLFLFYKIIKPPPSSNSSPPSNSSPLPFNFVSTGEIIRISARRRRAVRGRKSL